MSDREVTLHDFWLGSAKLANVAGHLLTERGGGDDSIWRDDPYGSAWVQLAGDGAADVLFHRELERVLTVVDVGGVIESVTTGTARVRLLDFRVAIDAETATLEG